MQAILADLNSALTLAAAVRADAHRSDSNSGQYVLPESSRALVTQATFVHMFVAFEEFLEKSFGYYATGGRGIGGSLAVCYSAAPTEEHFYRMVLGTNRYIDWATPDTVIKLADLYFDRGEPFSTPLNSAASDIRDMKTVRNAASHVSRTTTGAADALYNRWTAQPLTGVTAYQLLTAAGTRPLPNGAMPGTFLAHAERVLRNVSGEIANF